MTVNGQEPVGTGPVNLNVVPATGAAFAGLTMDQIQPEYGDEQADASRPNYQARTGTVEYFFPCSADHEQDWLSCPIVPYSCYNM